MVEDKLLKPNKYVYEFTLYLLISYFQEKNILLFKLFHNFSNTVKNDIITCSLNGSNYSGPYHNKSISKLDLTAKRKKRLRKTYDYKGELPANQTTERSYTHRHD